jgi:hypothetical protein
MRGNESFSGGHGGKKGRKLDAFIAAMMSHKTVEAAAEAVAISPATAYRWLQHADVVRRLAEARRDAMNRAIARLQEAATGAVDSLCQIQRDGESESARVSAARTILEQALRAVELSDVLERLDVLERAVKSQAFTPAGPKVSVTYEHEKNGKGNPNGQSSKAPFGGTGGSDEQ